MATAEVICGSCGAINRASADTCWRCLEAIETPAPAVTVSAAPKPAPGAAQSSA
jgi:hypothetical protein